ncbi:futalosine hydrolase [Streptantibioticus parmotrematis]|uniref:futalosine hydrolase n=1 Tax=Streptantibioticus parmotrematis TaxID=2873249 RepID=UPI00340F3F21
MLLVVTAVAAERDSAARGLTAPGGGDGDANAGVQHPLPGDRTALRLTGGPLGTVDLLAAGVGPAAVAAGTAAALAAAEAAGTPYDLVISTGIGGGFAPAAPVGSVVVADAIVAADLGAETPEGFVPVTELGFGTTRHLPPPELSRAAARAAGAGHGTVLTVSTVTGGAARARELTDRHPTALAEAMEGFGVAEAAAAHRVPVLEVRAVSNPVGPRDRAAWRIGDALAALGDAFRAMVPVLQEAKDHG